MFEFTETVLIDAAPERVWNAVSAIDSWWLQSNAEHVAMEHLDDRPVTEVGARLRIEERISGRPGEAVGVITSVDPGVEVTWEADAIYRCFGISVPVAEGVTWRVAEFSTTATELSAHVWARFPSSGFGRFAGVLFSRLLNGVAKDRAHTRTELEYLKSTIEA